MTESSSSRGLWVAVILFAAVFVSVFGSVLFLPRHFVYDSGYFHYPAFQLVQEEWAAGRIPLWNPYDNCGSPLAANATFCIFYPGKVLFHLGLPLALAFKVFVAAHVVLAGVFVFFLARSNCASRHAATIATLSYAFCGNVLFQHSNLPFLISAAWLPAACFAIERTLTKSSFAWAAAMGAVQAMMVLGGDPQMAFNVTLLAILYAIVIRLKRHQLSMKGAEKSEPTGDSRPFWRRSIVLIPVASICGLLLSAIQVVPTYEWNQECVRGRTSPVPRNIYEIAGHFRRASEFPQYDSPPWYSVLLGKELPPPNIAVYERSVEPWRFVEYLFPGVNGRSHSQNRRWICLPGFSDFPWTPSLYMGLLPFLLALWAWTLRRADAFFCWQSLCVLLSFFASLGKFGLGWCMRLISSGTAESGFFVGDGFGGVYWLMTVMLPTYASFRYPGKLLVITALGLSLLAGAGWDRLTKENVQSLKNLLWSVCILSLVAIAALLCVWPWWNNLNESISTHGFLGPFDTGGAYADAMYSFCHTAVIGLVLGWLLNKKMHQPKFQFATLALVTLDLILANGWLVPTASTTKWNEKPKLQALIERAEERFADQRGGVSQPFRVFQQSGLQPDSWWGQSSTSRLSEGERWLYDVMAPNYNLASRVEYVNSYGTFINYDLELLWSQRMFDSGNQQPIFVNTRQAYDVLNTKYFVIRHHNDPLVSRLSTVGLQRSWAVAGKERQVIPTGAPLEEISLKLPDQSFDDLRVLYNRDYFPRAWILHNWEVVKPPDPADTYRLRELSKVISFPNSSFKLKETAMVESNTLETGRYMFPVASASEQCRVSHYSPQRVVVDAKLTSKGLVVLSDLFDKHWELVHESGGRRQTKEILRTNRVMRGVVLEPGTHRLEFNYVPRSFYRAAVLSGCSWLALVIGLVVTFFTQRSDSNGRNDRRSSEQPDG